MIKELISTIMQPFLLIWYFLDAEEHKIISNRGLEILEEQKTKNDCIHDVSLSFEAKEKIIDLHGYVTEIEEVDGDVVWFYDQNGEYMSLRKKYVKRYSS